MYGKKALRLAGRFEPPHDLLSSPGGPVRNLRSIIQSLVGTMVDTRGKSLQSRAVASQFIGNKDTRLAALFEQFAKEAVCCLCIAA
ncbi:MAG: hypothetical protein ACI8Z1_004012 [Candidatus Azotimanducaceae bacterium]|jgi:hypothetical protein